MRISSSVKTESAPFSQVFRLFEGAQIDLKKEIALWLDLNSACFESRCSGPLAAVGRAELH